MKKINEIEDGLTGSSDDIYNYYRKQLKAKKKPVDTIEDKKIDSELTIVQKKDIEKKFVKYIKNKYEIFSHLKKIELTYLNEVGKALLKTTFKSKTLKDEMINPLDKVKNIILEEKKDLLERIKEIFITYQFILDLKETGNGLTKVTDIKTKKFFEAEKTEKPKKVLTKSQLDEEEFDIAKENYYEEFKLYCNELYDSLYLKYEEKIEFLKQELLKFKDEQEVNTLINQYIPQQKEQKQENINQDFENKVNSINLTKIDDEMERKGEEIQNVVDEPKVEEPVKPKEESKFEKFRKSILNKVSGK